MQYWRGVAMEGPHHLAGVLTTQLACRWREFEQQLDAAAAEEAAEVCSICLDEESQHKTPDVRVACCNTAFHLHCLGE